jgi:hypothetical protein
MARTNHSKRVPEICAASQILVELYGSKNFFHAIYSAGNFVVNRFCRYRKFSFQLLMTRSCIAQVQKVF